MIGFGFWDSSNNGFAGVNDDVLNILDFPMECLEGDDPAEDLDAKLQSLGPIPWETLQRLASALTCQVQNGSSNLQFNLSVSSEQECQLNMMPGFFEEIPSIDDSHNSPICKEHLDPLEACSPISGLSSIDSSFSHLKKTPISVNPPPSVLRRSKRKKKKLSQLYVIKKRPSKQEPNRSKQQATVMKKCTHCEITKTPQWRDGPLGPKSLCNACGVRYRIGRLLPEYRPAASPTFVPSLHSNNHKKVVEMRSGSQEPDLGEEKIKK